MDDLISRKAAVDTILGQTVFATKRELVERCDANISDENGWLGGICVALDAIEDLPSAQPEQRSFSCGQENDLISRQAAIDAAYKVIERDTSGNNVVVNAMIAWSEYIRTLPSSQPVARDINVLSNDLISRKATIAALEKEGLITAMVIVDRLPPVQPEPYQEEGDE